MYRKVLLRVRRAAKEKLMKMMAVPARAVEIIVGSILTAISRSGPREIPLVPQNAVKIPTRLPRFSFACLVEKSHIISPMDAIIVRKCQWPAPV